MSVTMRSFFRISTIFVFSFFIFVLASTKASAACSITTADSYPENDPAQLPYGYHIVSNIAETESNLISSNRLCLVLGQGDGQLVSTDDFRTESTVNITGNAMFYQSTVSNDCSVANLSSQLCSKSITPTATQVTCSIDSVNVTQQSPGYRYTIGYGTANISSSEISQYGLYLDATLLTTLSSGSVSYTFPTSENESNKTLSIHKTSTTAPLCSLSVPAIATCGGVLTGGQLQAQCFCPSGENNLSAPYPVLPAICCGWVDPQHPSVCSDHSLTCSATSANGCANQTAQYTSCTNSAFPGNPPNSGTCTFTSDPHTDTSCTCKVTPIACPLTDVCLSSSTCTSGTGIATVCQGTGSSQGTICCPVSNVSCGTLFNPGQTTCSCSGAPAPQSPPGSTQKCCGWLTGSTCAAQAPSTPPNPTVGGLDLNALNVIIFGKQPDASMLTPKGIISHALPILFVLSGLILFIMFIWGGFEMLTGAANPKSQEAGKQRITAAVIGFLIIFASYWIAQIVQAIFGISIL